MVESSGPSCAGPLHGRPQGFAPAPPGNIDLGTWTLERKRRNPIHARRHPGQYSRYAKKPDLLGYPVGDDRCADRSKPLQGYSQPGGTAIRRWCVRPGWLGSLIPRLKRIWLWAIPLLALAGCQPGAPDPDYVPPYSPQAALDTFELAPGLRHRGVCGGAPDSRSCCHGYGRRRTHLCGRNGRLPSEYRAHREDSSSGVPPKSGHPKRLKRP